MINTITCKPHTALGILAICNFYADNNCHNVLSDDTARRMIKTVVEGLKLGDDTTCSINLDDVTCEDLHLLLSYYARTVPINDDGLHDVIGQLFKTLKY